MQYCETCKQGTEYNGWSNLETWACKLHIDNDQETHNVAKTAETPYHLEQIAKSLIDENESMREDIGSVWRVNFKEIWESYEDDRKLSARYADVYSIPPEVCMSALDENLIPSTQGVTSHVWDDTTKPVSCAECGTEKPVPCPDCAGTMDKHTRASCNE